MVTNLLDMAREWEQRDPSRAHELYRLSLQVEPDDPELVRTMLKNVDWIYCVSVLTQLFRLPIMLYFWMKQAMSSNAMKQDDCIVEQLQFRLKYQLIMGTMRFILK